MEKRFDISDFVNVTTQQSVVCELTKRVRLRRRELKLSQKELALRSGVSYASIRRFESEGEISLSSLLKIAGVFDMLEDFNQLFNRQIINNLKDL